MSKPTIIYKKQLVEFDELPLYFQEKLVSLPNSKFNNKKENGINTTSETKGGNSKANTSSKAGSETKGGNSKAKAKTEG